MRKIRDAVFQKLSDVLSKMASHTANDRVQAILPAVKTCPKCAAVVPDKVLVCQFCRHKFSIFQGGRMSAWGVIGFVILGLVAFSAINAAYEAHEGAADASAGLKALQDKYGQNGSSPNPHITPEQEKLLSGAIDNPWSYENLSDDISGGSIVVAFSISDNKVNFDSPYDGGSSLSLNIRKHPRRGTDAFVKISKGQIICDFSEGCPIHVSFDGGKVRTFTGRMPSDYSSTTLFIQPTGAFIAALQESKKAVIEVQFYTGGNQQFTFDTANLHWPPLKTDLTPP